MTANNDIDPVFEPLSSKNPTTEPSASDPIQPADVPLTQTHKTSVEEPLPWQQRPTTYAALVVSLLLALVVIFVLPSLIKPPKTPPTVIEPQAISTASVQENPFRDAQLAKARRESQDSLSKLLEKQNFLEKKNVLLWDEKAFKAALQKAAEGDLLYRQREFNQALTTYQDSLKQLTALESRVPEELSSNLKKGADAFFGGDAIKAKQFYELALAIDSSNAEAKSGIARAGTLNSVLALIKQGRNALEEQKLEQAQSLFQEALALDAHHPDALAGNTQTTNLILSRDFNSAMSRGYQALEDNQLNRAAKEFREALTLRPNDNAAQSGLTQANTASAQQTTRAQLNNAASLEAKEQWHQARDIYTGVLARDSSVVEAKLGQLRSLARANLSDDIDKILQSPLRLASTNVYQHAQQLLKDAKGIRPSGPLHTRQTNQLSDVLQKAITPVTVELHSDNTTNVTLFKVGELGLFGLKHILLKPGNYVAVGNRTGYRDVRVEFQVTSEGLAAPVEVVCREPIP
ncbi:MAG: hypothetical protein QNK31_11110 [Porticoccus sp.]|nr:hypothetical protein [Porticoccus sp.]